MRIVLGSWGEGGEAALTTESCACRYGAPVLEITGDGIDGDFGPSDLMPDSWTVSAADVVYSWACEESRTPEEVEAARKFLRQWPEGPQL